MRQKIIQGPTAGMATKLRCAIVAAPRTQSLQALSAGAERPWFGVFAAFMIGF
jgi:hypothetical protein